MSSISGDVCMQYIIDTDFGDKKCETTDKLTQKASPLARASQLLSSSYLSNSGSLYRSKLQRKEDFQ